VCSFLPVFLVLGKTTLAGQLEFQDEGRDARSAHPIQGGVIERPCQSPTALRSQRRLLQAIPTTAEAVHVLIGAAAGCNPVLIAHWEAVLDWILFIRILVRQSFFV